MSGAISCHKQRHMKLLIYAVKGLLFSKTSIFPTSLPKCRPISLSRESLTIPRDGVSVENYRDVYEEKSLDRLIPVSWEYPG